MWPRFGIKVGNSTLCIAHVKAGDGGKIEVIANKQGDRVSPACLLWDGADEIECGLTAKQKMATRPKQAVANSFQLLLPPDVINMDKVKAATKEIPCEYDPEKCTFILKSATHREDESRESTRQLSAYEVQVQLLRSELELARQYLSDIEQKPIVVLSIPSFYPQEAWSMLSQAAEEAGFQVAQILAEPTAAVLAYGISEVEAETGPSTDNSKYVLAIKSGGLFTHFTLYTIRDGLYTQLDSYGPLPVGGRHFTEALVQFICEEFQRRNKLDPQESRRSVAKIRTAATNCKHILTTLPSTQLYIDSLMDGVDFNTQMSRARFESLIQPVIADFMQTLGEWVERAMKQHSEMMRIDSIVLLGATMRIPKLQAAIAARFPEAQLQATISADEVVAVGCARQATYLVEPHTTELEPTEDCICAEQDLVMWHGEDEANAKVVIGRGALLPTTVQLDVKLSKAAENAEIFRLRSGEQIHEVCLRGAAPTDDEVFQIEANVDFMGTDEDIKPVIRLRCV